MMENFLDQIMSPNTVLKTEFNIFRLSHPSTFVNASIYLSTVVARIYSTTNLLSGHFRKSGIYCNGRGDHSSEIVGHFNGRGWGIGRGARGREVRGVHGQGGHGGGSSAYENGIDIADVTRYFEYADWDTISNKTRERIADDPIRTEFLSKKRDRPPDPSFTEKRTRISYSPRSSMGFKTKSLMNLDWQEEWYISPLMGSGHKCQLQTEAWTLQ